MDAPIGYIATLKEFSKKNKKFEDIWDNEDNGEIYHFIGKDIAYFHALFWPSILNGAGYRTPNGIFCHGFLTVDGKKMSKSRGTFIKASDYLKYLDPEFLRYYFASRLNDNIEDIDLNFDDLISKINSDLIGKFINIASRTQNFLVKLNGSKIVTGSLSKSDEFADIYKEIIYQIDNKEYSKALKNIMSLADKINAYVSKEEPWKKAKNGDEAGCLKVCSEALNVFKDLTILMQPFLPDITSKALEMLNLEKLDYTDLNTDNIRNVDKFKPFIKRLEKSEFEGILD